MTREKEEQTCQVVHFSVNKWLCTNSESCFSVGRLCSSGRRNKKKIRCARNIFSDFSLHFSWQDFSFGGLRANDEWIKTLRAGLINGQLWHSADLSVNVFSVILSADGIMKTFQTKVTLDGRRQVKSDSSHLTLCMQIERQTYAGVISF